MLLLVPLSLSFTEPQRHKTVFTKNHMHDIFKALKTSILKNIKLRWLFVYSATIVGFISISYYLYQPYFELSGLDITYFGFVFAGFNLVSALSSKYSHLLERKIGRKYSLILLFILIGFGYLLMSNFIYLFSFCFAFLIQFVKGFSSVVISDYVHQLTESNIRATVLSAKSLIEKMFYAIMTPIIGWIVDIYTLQWALALSGIFVLIAGIPILLLLWKNKVLQNE